MKRPEQITYERLCNLIFYDPVDGSFLWTRTTRNGKRRAGDKAGSKNTEGYWQISIDGFQYKAHRLAWLFSYGKWPTADIDHANRDRMDNRLENLRAATRAANAANRCKHKNNKSGFKGVVFHPGTGKWRAQICTNYSRTHIGLFDSPEKAHGAYCDAAQKVFGEFWRAT